MSILTLEIALVGYTFISLDRCWTTADLQHWMEWTVLWLSLILSRISPVCVSHYTDTQELLDNCTYMESLYQLVHICKWMLYCSVQIHTTFLIWEHYFSHTHAQPHHYINYPIIVLAGLHYSLVRMLALCLLLLNRHVLLGGTNVFK